MPNRKSHNFIFVVFYKDRNGGFRLNVMYQNVWQPGFQGPSNTVHPHPIFGPCLLWPNGWMDQDATWHGGRPCPVHIALDGDTAPLPQKGDRAHLYCGQTAGCIKMLLGMEVGLSPGDFVLDGDPAPVPKKGRSPLIFGPRLLWLNGCMDQYGTWHGGGPWSRPHCSR